MNWSESIIMLIFDTSGRRAVSLLFELVSQDFQRLTDVWQFPTKMVSHHTVTLLIRDVSRGPSRLQVPRQTLVSRNVHALRAKSRVSKYRIELKNSLFCYLRNIYIFALLKYVNSDWRISMQNIPPSSALFCQCVFLYLGKGRFMA
jgi:hypothetical protein